MNNHPPSFRHGKASFGVLLLQDLAVVPLLIVVELLGQGSDGMALALVRAATKAIITLATMSFIGKKVCMYVRLSHHRP
jgi:CPA2 family monovalent cation:H+ antiporter-2